MRANSAAYAAEMTRQEFELKKRELEGSIATMFATTEGAYAGWEIADSGAAAVNQALFDKLARVWSDPERHDANHQPDLVLIYRNPDDTVLQLVRLGSHSELGLRPRLVGDHA